MDELNKEIIAENAEEKRTPDGDLQSAFDHNSVENFPIDAIDNVVAAVYGEADGPSWFWLVEAKEESFPAQAGAYALLEGGCDYTGWDCQSYLKVVAQGGLFECVDAAPEFESGRPIRNTLGRQAALDLPFGLTEAV